jgi:hypothetical protein
MLLRSLALPALLLLSSLASAQTPEGAKAGSVEVPDFQGVAVSHGIRAEVKRGPKSVRLEGDAKQIPRVKLEVKDGVLTTEVKGSNFFFSPGVDGVRLIVTNPQVTSVAASGGSEVDAEATPATEFSAAASGGGEVRVTGLETSSLKTSASGGATVTLAGRADSVTANASGGSVVQAEDVRAQTLEVNVSGGSRFEAHSAQKVTGNLSGGSTVRLQEKPGSINVNTSGGSEVKYK